MRLTDAIGALEESAGAARAEAEIETLARDIASRALREAGAASIAFRLPSFLSERARQIVPTWAALPARSLLPLGQKRFYLPMARGVASAAGGAPQVSLLLSGVTEFAEVEALQRELDAVNVRVGGAVVRSFAAVHNLAERSGAGFDIWVDVEAMVRAAYGFPSELMSAQGVFSEYARLGYIASDPQLTLAPFLSAPLEALLSGMGSERAGALFGAGAPTSMLAALYRLGFRRFCAPVNDSEQISLRLARTALGIA